MERLLLVWAFNASFPPPPGGSLLSVAHHSPYTPTNRCTTSCPVSLQALLDTVLVLAIVAVSGGLLLGVNVVLANLSEAWYKAL